MPAEDSQLEPGTLLHGRYRIERVISHGGFGNVYLAHDQLFDREVAIKEAFFNDEETRKQFDLEAQILIHITHRGIVRGFATFEENHRFYLVMQYIAGMNLEEKQIAHFKQQRGPIPETQVLSLMVPICAATQALHDGHILHRDIKPANIKFDGTTDEPILLDLGLAKLFKDRDSQTMIAAQAYTPGYAPLEQCEENGSTTERTDIYALGATVFYALTGRQPWESLHRLREVHAGRPDMPTPSHLAPRISKTTDAIVMRALALEPADRYASVKDMQAALHAALTAPETLCARCGTVNVVGAETCVYCKSALPRTVSMRSRAVASVGAPTVSPMLNSGEVPPLPSTPEPVHARILVTPRRSPLALVVLILGALSLCPGAGAFVWLAVFPMGAVTLTRIRRSRGARSGIGQTLLGMFLTVVGLVEVILIYVLAVHPKF